MKSQGKKLNMFWFSIVRGGGVESVPTLREGVAKSIPKCTRGRIYNCRF